MLSGLRASKDWVLQVRVLVQRISSGAVAVAAGFRSARVSSQSVLSVTCEAGRSQVLVGDEASP